MKHEFLPTRPETLFGVTRRMLHERRCSMGTFAQRVVDAYCARVPAEARGVQFKFDGDAFDQARINAQKLTRYMDAGISARLPCELEEAWVQALDEPYRSECVSALAKRYGLLAVPVPDTTTVGCDVQALGLATGEFGKWMASLAPIMDDGAIKACDAPHIPAAVARCDELIAALHGYRARLKAIEMAGAPR